MESGLGSRRPRRSPAMGYYWFELGNLCECVVGTFLGRGLEPEQDLVRGCVVSGQVDLVEQLAGETRHAGPGPVAWVG
eukprot:3651818-Pyramimonas_sp.AAC.1